MSRHDPKVTLRQIADYEVLWQAAQHRVPGLLATVEHMLHDLESGGLA